MGKVGKSGSVLVIGFCVVALIVGRERLFHMPERRSRFRGTIQPQGQAKPRPRRGRNHTGHHQRPDRKLRREAFGFGGSGLTGGGFLRRFWRGFFFDRDFFNGDRALGHWSRWGLPWGRDHRGDRWRRFGGFEFVEGRGRGSDRLLELVEPGGNVARALFRVGVQGRENGRPQGQGDSFGPFRPILNRNVIEEGSRGRVRAGEQEIQDSAEAVEVGLGTERTFRLVLFGGGVARREHRGVGTAEFRSEVAGDAHIHHHHIAGVGAIDQVVGLEVKVLQPGAMEGIDRPSDLLTPADRLNRFDRAVGVDFIEESGAKNAIAHPIGVAVFGEAFPNAG